MRKFAREHEGLKAAKAAILYDQAAAYSVGLQDEFAKAFRSSAARSCRRKRTRRAIRISRPS